MLTFSKARKLAETYVEVMCDGKAELVREAVIAKPYGWVFFYQSSAHLRETSNISDAFAGNAPFIVDRDSGEIRVLGTALPAETYLENFESNLPPARLYRKPELPSW